MAIRAPDGANKAHENMNQELYCTMHCKALNVIFVSCFCETTHSVAFDTFRKLRKQFYVNSYSAQLYTLGGGSQFFFILQFFME